MIIKVDEIPEGGKDLLFDGEQPVLGELRDASEPVEDVQIDPRITGRVRVVRDGELVFLVGSVRGRASLQCARCLERFEEERPLDVDLVFRRVAHVDDSVEPDEEAILFEGPDLDPAEALLQEFLLDLPMNPLCRADCPGLCPQCGSLVGSPECRCDAQESVNPRWAALTELKKKLNP
ncbi:MAG: YceD family protein [Thermodesulfobacteriota bacterium]